MCDIWKGNGNLRQLTEADVRELLVSLKQLRTRQVAMSGGEALLNPNLFRLCDMLRAEGITITILSTGLLLGRYAHQIVEKSDEVIVSLDGSEDIHNAIRDIPNAYRMLRDGVAAVKAINPRYPVSGRCVIQRLNFADWPRIVDAARDIGLDRISFLPADISTEAFNHPESWSEEQVAHIRLTLDEVMQLREVIENLIRDYSADFTSGYIAESPDKLRRIYEYYAAFHGLGEFPRVRCNAPWVSAVVEADGAVRPCFFHPSIGNIRQSSLPELINSEASIAFRRNLDMDTDPICRRCVCSVNLHPTIKLG
jgi:MoaA/NifB/PqqE/SkfB family radical SAM enzyme